MRHSRLWAALTLIGVLALGARISGYVFWSGAKWPAPSIVMQLQLGSSSTPFTVANNVASMIVASIDATHLQIALTFSCVVKATNRTLTRKCTLIAKARP